LTHFGKLSPEKVVSPKEDVVEVKEDFFGRELPDEHMPREFPDAEI